MPRFEEDLSTSAPPSRSDAPMAVILAAGYGRRMRPLTDHGHKTLLRVGGKTILGRLVEGLLENGIQDVVVVTGHRAREVEAHLRAEYPGVHFQFAFNERYRETNNIFSLALAFERVPVDRDVLVIESDLVMSPEVLRRLVRSPHPNVALLDRYRPGMDGTVVVVNDGFVTDVVPPHRQHGEFSFTGKYKTLNLYKFSREFCTTSFRRLLTYYARAIDDDCYYELILGVLIYLRQVSIAAEILDGEAWAEVDDPNDLHVARFKLDPPLRREILEAAKGGFWAHDVVDYHYLRNMHFPTAAMFAELRAALPSLLQNYGSSQATLDEKLSYVLLCNRERVHAVSGAAQLFPWLSAHFEGKRVLLPDPTFGEWSRAFPQASRYGDRVGVEASDIERLAREKELVVFVNPNNPTGTCLDSEWIVAFAKARPHTFVLVDESFQGFTSRVSVVERLEKEPLANVAVVASLSKTLGVPGARLGYLYTANGELGARVARETPIWNMGSVAEHILELVLKHRPSLADSFVRTAQEREIFRIALAAVPGVRHVYPSAGNFLLTSLSCPSDRPRTGLGGRSGAFPSEELSVADRLLRERAIYVKDVSNRFDDGLTWLRLAVRSAVENAAFCEALADTLRPKS